jgi:hypothetical protein
MLQENSYTYSESDPNILIAPSLSDPQKSGSGVKPVHAFGFSGLL